MNPWTKSEAVRVVENARRRAERDPRRLAEFRAECAAKILPHLARLELDPLLEAVMLAYCGLDGGERLLSRRELCLLPGLRKPNQHPRFCRQVVWHVLEGDRA